MVYAFIHQCRHVGEYRLLGSQVNREAVFAGADNIVPAFVEIRCLKCERRYIQPASLPYTPLDRETRVMAVSSIDDEYDNCHQSVADYNEFAEQYQLSPILLTEFEHLLTCVYNWVTRAEEFANRNASRYFHDVCLAIAESTLCQVVAMRLSVDLATNVMPAPETAVIVHPEDISFPRNGVPKLRDICPELADHTLALTYTPKVDYGVQPLPKGYSSFESVWRSKVKYMNTRPLSYFLKPATFGSF